MEKGLRIENGTLYVDSIRKSVDYFRSHDRPMKSELEEYVYIMECKDAGYSDYLKLVTLTEFTFRYLGSFSIG